jgi:hypothetical protein
VVQTHLIPSSSLLYHYPRSFSPSGSYQGACFMFCAFIKIITKLCIFLSWRWK